MNPTDDLLIKRTSTADQVAQAIRGRILSGELKPGTPLREVALAGSMGVSRNTVREGIRVLVGEGLVRHSIHRGVFVSLLTIEDVTDIYRVRAIVETAAVSTHDPFPDTSLREMQRTVAELEGAIKASDSEAIVDADFRFHQQLVAALDSPRISALFATALAELKLGLVFLDSTDHQESPDNWLRHHREICSLLELGKYRECKKVIERHLSYAEGRLIRDMAAANDQNARPAGDSPDDA